MRGIALLAICCVLTACSNEKMREAPGSGGEKSMRATEKVYISSAAILPGVTANNEIQVKIKGNLPSPAYKIQKYDISVKGPKIEITPLAHFDKNIVAIQMLVAFEDTVTVRLKTLGTHFLRVNGRSNTVTTETVISK